MCWLQQSQAVPPRIAMGDRDLHWHRLGLLQHEASAANLTSLPIVPALPHAPALPALPSWSAPRCSDACAWEHVQGTTHDGGRSCWRNLHQQYLSGAPELRRSDEDSEYEGTATRTGGGFRPAVALADFAVAMLCAAAGVPLEHAPHMLHLLPMAPPRPRYGGPCVSVPTGTPVSGRRRGTRHQSVFTGARSQAPALRRAARAR